MNDFYIDQYEEEINQLVKENERYVEEAILLVSLLLLLMKENNLNKMEIDKHMKKLNVLKLNMDRFNEEWAKNQAENSALDGMIIALATLGLMSGPQNKLELSKLRKSMKLIPSNKQLLDSVLFDLENDLKNVTTNIQRRTRQSMNEIIAENMRKNLARKNFDANSITDETMISLKKRFGDKVDHVITDSLGRRWKSRDYVNTLVTSKLMDLSNRTSINEALSRGYGLARITFAPDTKDMCRIHQGRIIKLDESIDADYPSYDELKASGQIFHPFCRHRIQPIRSEDSLTVDELVEAERKNELSDEALLTGTRSLNKALSLMGLTEDDL